VKAIKQTKAKKAKRAEFVKRFTDLAVQHLSTLTPAEQRKQVEAIQRHLGVSDTHPKPSGTEETRVIRLEAQSDHE
jgi:hypothetical protein